MRICISAHINSVETARVQHNSRKGQVAEHPSQHDRRPETLVIILVLLLCRELLLRRFPLGAEDGKFSLVLRIEIRVISGNSDIDLATRLGDSGWQFLWLVVTLCTPRDIVSVAKGVDVENIDVGRSEEEVLEETREHVPRVEEQEGDDKVEEVCRGHRYDEGEEECVGEEVAELEALVVFDFGLYRLYGDEDGREQEITMRDVSKVVREGWSGWTYTMSIAQK